MQITNVMYRSWIRAVHRTSLLLYLSQILSQLLRINTDSLDNTAKHRTTVTLSFWGFQLPFAAGACLCPVFFKGFQLTKNNFPRIAEKYLEFTIAKELKMIDKYWPCVKSLPSCQPLNVNMGEIWRDVDSSPLIQYKKRNRCHFLVWAKYSAAGTAIGCRVTSIIKNYSSCIYPRPFKAMQDLRCTSYTLLILTNPLVKPTSRTVPTDLSMSFFKRVTS